MSLTGDFRSKITELRDRRAVCLKLRPLLWNPKRNGDFPVGDPTLDAQIKKPGTESPSTSLDWGIERKVRVLCLGQHEARGKQHAKVMIETALYRDP
jgi:hypothetical protein